MAVAVILDLRNFIGMGPDSRGALLFQISSKLVNWLQIYKDFSIFQDGSRPPS